MSDKLLIIGERSETQIDRYSLKTVVSRFSEGTYRDDYALQRSPGCLGKKEQSGLITSAIRGENIDPIKLCEEILENGKRRLWLTDGLQRLSTFRDYIKNVFPIAKDQKKPWIGYKKVVDGEEEIIKFDLRGKFYRDLPPQIQEQLLDYSVQVVVNLDCDDEDMAYHIDRFNNIARMTTNQRNFLCMTNVAKTIKELTENHRFFLDAGNYSEPERTKGVLLRVVMEAMMLEFHFDQWAKGKKMNERLNEIASDVEFNLFEDELDRLTPIIDKKTTGQLFNSKNSFIWFGAFHKFAEFGLEDTKFAEFLSAFQDTLHSKTFDEYEGESFDTYDSGKGTKDKKVVAAKLDMLEKLMREYFGLVDHKPEEDKHEEKNENVVTEPERDDVSPVEVSKIEENSNVETVEENHVPTADELENDHILAFVQETVDPGVEMDDVQMYKEFLDDYVRDGSHVKTVGNAVLVAMLAYAYKIDKDEELSEWLDIISKRNDKYSPCDSVNFKYFKMDFDKYIDCLKVHAVA